MELAHQIEGEGISWEEQERRELESLLRREGKIECEEVLGAAGSSGIYQQRLCVIICFIWLLQGVGLYQLPLLFQSPKLMCTAESFQDKQILRTNTGIDIGNVNELGIMQQRSQQDHFSQGISRQQQYNHDNFKNHTEIQTFTRTDHKVIQLHGLQNTSSKQPNITSHKLSYLQQQQQLQNLTMDPKAVFECWESPKVCDISPMKIAATSGGQSSLTSEFMLLCDMYSLKVIMIGCFFLGCVAGTILTQSVLSGKTVGTSMLLKMSIPLEGISVIALSFIENSYEGVCLSLFGCGLFGFSSWSSSLAIIRESCSKQQFAHYRSVLFLANATAQMTITPFYSYMHDWRRELIFVVGLPIMFLGLCIVPFFILESPAYFLRTKNPDKLYKVLSKIAGINYTKCFFTKTEFMEIFEKMIRNSQNQGRLEDAMGQENAEQNLNIIIANGQEDNISNDRRFQNQEIIENNQREEEDHKSQEYFTRQRSFNNINQQQQRIFSDNHSIGKDVIIREFELTPTSRKDDKSNGIDIQIHNKENSQLFSGAIQTTAGSTDPQKVTDKNNTIYYTSSLFTFPLQGREINQEQLNQEKQNKLKFQNNEPKIHEINQQIKEENKFEIDFQQWKPNEELENVSNKGQSLVQQLQQQDSGEMIQDKQSQKKSLRSIREQTETIRSQNRSQIPSGQQHSQSENIPQSNNATFSMNNRPSMTHCQPFNNKSNNLNDLGGITQTAFQNFQPTQPADQEIRNNPIFVLPIRNQSHSYVQSNVPIENNVCEESELETLAVTTKSALCAHMRRVAQYVIAQMILTSFYYGIFFEMEKFGVNLPANMFALGFSEFVAILATDKLLEFHPPRYSLKQTLFIIGVISATVFVVRHSPLDDLEQPLNNNNAFNNNNLSFLKIIELFLLGIIRFFTISGFSLILVKCKQSEPTQAFRQNAWKAIASFGSLGLLIPPALLFATQDIYPTFFLLGLVSVLASFLTQDE